MRLKITRNAWLEWFSVIKSLTALGKGGGGKGGGPEYTEDRGGDMNQEKSKYDLWQRHVLK
jgi:hypothetical protein